MARKKNFKRCPRCDTKCPIHHPKCPTCGLIYSRLVYATNREAKKALRKKQKHLVVYDKVLPSDVNKWKLFFMTLFLGVFGGHNFYTGRIGKGVAKLIGMLMVTIAAMLPLTWWNIPALSVLMWILIIPSAFCVIFWVMDTIKILANGFRVPIAIEEDRMRVETEKQPNKEENKEVLKIVDEVSKKAEKQIEEQKEQQEEEEQQPEPEPEVEEEPFVPQSKVISSQEVKKLLSKKAQQAKKSKQTNKSNNNNNKKKKK